MVRPLNGTFANIAALQDFAVSVVVIDWVANSVKNVNLRILQFRTTLFR